MRSEIKIALGLFAAITIMGQLISVPEFASGLFYGLSIFFMITGMLPENLYLKFKARQGKKLSHIKEIVRIN